MSSDAERTELIELVRAICDSESLSKDGTEASEFLDDMDYEAALEDIPLSTARFLRKENMPHIGRYAKYLAKGLCSVATRRYRTRLYNIHWCKPEKVCDRLNHASNVIQALPPAPFVRTPSKGDHDYLVAVFRKTYALIRELGVQDILLRPDSIYCYATWQFFPNTIHKIPQTPDYHTSLAAIVSALKGHRISDSSEVVRFQLV